MHSVHFAKERANEEMLAMRYRAVRSFTTALAAPLCEEDYVVQSMPDASPTKWHLAHTTWFFETFVLGADVPGYRAVRPALRATCSTRTTTPSASVIRGPQRGLLSRPTLAEVRALPRPRRRAR